MTTHSSPDAGWYADPNGGSGLRYWDGAAWTDASRPAPATAGYPAGHSASAPGGGYPAAGAGYPSTGSSGAGYPGTPYPYPGAGFPPADRSTPSFVARNKFFLITAAICGIYALVATFSNFALFGVLPALYTFRSFQAKEPLAIAALVVTVATIFFSLNHIYS